MASRKDCNPQIFFAKQKRSEATAKDAFHSSQSDEGLCGYGLEKKYVLHIHFTQYFPTGTELYRQ